MNKYNEYSQCWVFHCLGWSWECVAGHLGVQVFIPVGHLSTALYTIIWGAFNVNTYLM